MIYLVFLENLILLIALYLISMKFINKNLLQPIYFLEFHLYAFISKLLCFGMIVSICSIMNPVYKVEILLSGLLTYLLVHTWEAFKIQSILDRKDVS